MSNMTARAVSTVGIWLAVAVSLAAGVFQRNWTGDMALLMLFMIVVALCGAAAGATVAVWHGSDKSAVASASDRAGSSAEPAPAADRSSNTAFREM
jgi:hypothetical protein